MTKLAFIAILKPKRIAKMSDFDFLKGNIETIILNALFNGDKYGYEIAREIKEKTANKYEIKQPTLYSYLKRLADRELIVSYWGGDDSNGGRRKYYKLTDSGKKICIDYMSEWNFHREVMDSLVGDTTDVAPLSEVTREQAATMLGSKTKRQKKRTETTQDELDEINKKLSLLNAEEKPLQETNEQQQTPREIDPLQHQRFEELIKPLKEEAANGNIPVSQQPLKEKITIDQPKNQPDVAPAPVFTHTKQQDDSLINTSPIQREETEEEQQYKRILEGVLGNQLDNVNQDAAPTAKYDDSLALAAQQAAKKQIMPLVETAETLKKEGIPIKIYSNTAKYTPVKMIFTNKINMFTACIMALLLAVELTVMYFAFKSFAKIKFTAYGTLIGVFALIAGYFAVMYFANPSKKSKLKFSFKYTFTNSIIFFAVAIVIIAIVYFVIIGTGNTAQLANIFLMPSIICLNAPLAVWIYSLIVKHTI